MRSDLEIFAYLFSSLIPWVDGADVTMDGVIITGDIEEPVIIANNAIRKVIKPSK